MDKLAALHKRLRLICGLLDGAAGMIRDVPLSPTNEHIRRTGEALCSVFEIQQAIYKLRPELEVPYEEPPEEVRAANRRLGEILIAAYELADSHKLSDAVALLQEFVRTETSQEHSELAVAELTRMKASYET